MWHHLRRLNCNVQKLGFDDTDTKQTKDVCPFIGYTEYKTIFCSLIFWQILVLLPLASNKIIHQI